MQISIISWTKKYFFENGVKSAAEGILEDRWAVYEVSKKHNIPRSNIL
jgi:hypothetical protein